MFFSQRVLLNSTDLSKDVNNAVAGSVVIPIVVGDYLYIGAEHPFNHLHFELPVPNTQPSNLVVEQWWANAWNTAKDVIDETALTGASFGQSGKVVFKSSRVTGWDRELESDQIPGLSGTTIDSFYWARLSWSADLDSTTEASFVGQKLCDEANLFAEYPDLNNADLLDAWKPGKTDWNEQIFVASQMVVQQLRSQGVVWSKFQIVDYERLIEPAVHRTAAIIYRGSGKGWDEYFNHAMRDFNASMKQGMFAIDLNRDAQIGEIEKRQTVTWGSR